MSDFDKARETIGGIGDPTGTQQYLTFSIMGEEYGVSIMTVREIKGWTESTRLPNSPDYMRGVMNLRGLIIPIFDLRARFNRGTTEATAKHVIIILAVENRSVGILVDAVSDILTITDADIKAAPETEQQTNGGFISGLISVEDRMVVLLSVEKLFDAKHLNAAEQSSAAAA